MRRWIIALALVAAVVGFVLWRRKASAAITPPAQQLGTTPAPPPGPAPIQPTEAPTFAMVNAITAQTAIMAKSIFAAATAGVPSTTAKPPPAPPPPPSKPGISVATGMTQSYVTHTVNGQKVQVKRK